MGIETNWQKIAEGLDTIAFADNGMAEMEIAGKSILLIRQKDQLFACAQKCPHASGRLSEGYIDALGQIVCPLHRYKFNLKTGRNTSGEGYFLKTYAAEERKEGIFIRIDEDIFGKG
jgi:nitrite reductase/ring-hydroxylating ferredoxin subunit